MCGFTFVYRPGMEREALFAISKKATDALFHRGPDEEGFLGETPFFFGHRRLSIIDLSGSRQPMTDPSGRFVLVYNGELYDYRDLRRELKQHWTFQTGGDTEVVLAGLILYGERFLSRMEGMWALALWDKTEKTLLLSRDRMGKKPLFYQKGKDDFICASELGALGMLAKRPWNEDMDSTADYLRYGFYLPGTTAYEHVREVMPGRVLTWNPEKGATEKPFWTLSVGGFAGNRQNAAALLKEKLIKAVKRRLVADVEVGAFLSGGVDSSLVVSILSRYLGKREDLKTFTIGFSDGSFDESRYAAIVAETCGTEHIVKRFDRFAPNRLTRLILNSVGQPFADSSLLPTAMVSEVAANRLKVSLSGDGGDELFSGYQRYQARAILRWYSRLPDFFRKNVENAVRLLPEPMSHHSRSVLKKAHLFLDIATRNKNARPYVAPEWYSESEFNKLCPDIASRGHTPPGFPLTGESYHFSDMMAADALVYLPQDILVKVDRASMAHSLEARAPFLDREVVELAFSLPPRWHRRRLSGKRLLRESFSELLPDIIWNRRKQGFSVPVHRWIEKEVGDKIGEIVSTVKTPLNPEFVMRMLQSHREKKRDQSHRLWSVYVYYLWLSEGQWR